MPGGTLTNTTGVAVTSTGAATTDGSGNCCYRQSRYCPSPGGLSGLWLPVADAVGTIKQGPQCYYFDGADPASDCPSTLHSGYSAVSGCGDAACVSCPTVTCPVAAGSECGFCCGSAANSTPDQITVVVAGIDARTCGCTACDPACPGGPATTYNVATLLINGTYVLLQGWNGSNCVWGKAACGSYSVDTHFACDCSDGVFATDAGSFTITAAKLDAVTWEVIITDDADDEVFRGTGIGNDCKPSGLVITDVSGRTCCTNFVASGTSTLARDGGTVSLTAC